LNKFAPVAFILLLSCGIALWFLASDSLNVYIKSQLQTLASKLSQQNVTVENVTIRSYQGSGTMTNIIIKRSDTDNVLNTSLPTLTIDSIDLTINRETLKDEVIIIDNITIHGLVVSVTTDIDNGTSLDQLLTTVQKNIPDVKSTINADIETANKQKVERPNLNVVKVIIASGELQYVNKNNGQITTKALPTIEWENISTESGTSGETIGIKIFEQLLKELAIYSKSSLSSN